MEGLALILFFLTLIGIIASIILMIYSIIKKDFKYRPKNLFIVLIGFIVAFIGTTIFYGAVQTPESKSKYEASQKSKAEEKAQKQLVEQQQKAQEKKDVSDKVEAEEKLKEDASIKTEVKNEEKAKVDEKFILTTEANTSASVDELILKGKNNSKSATKDDIKEAIKFIKDNYNKYWNDNETMQRTMYYGALLQYSNESKDIKKLGEDAVQVVKYVYRKADKIEDDSTQSNLKQIKKSLDKILSDLK